METSLDLIQGTHYFACPSGEVFVLGKLTVCYVALSQVCGEKCFYQGNLQVASEIEKK